MKLTSVSISNFKAIKEAELEIADFNVLVGNNGSGKSSVLQALHWALQAVRHPEVKPSADPAKGSTLSERDAIYTPSPDYLDAGQGARYGNSGKVRPQLDLNLGAVMDDGETLTAHMWIAAARNEGISVNAPSKNQVVSTIRDRKREISAYIPGVAGIAASEEKRSKLVVHRSAAAGDANTMLRNVLALLDAEHDGEASLLQKVQAYVSQVVGEVSLRIDFNEDKDTSIKAQFQTEQIKSLDPKRFTPLEFAGTGLLQVLQIFAYLVYFRPRLLLVDEPDAHLHPLAQERLMRVLAGAALEEGAQVILTTHSPSIVRALPPEAKVIWMKDGTVHPEGDTEGRALMGWGLLDRRVLLMTEDSNTGMLRNLLAQWPDLERVTAIWPLDGSSNLPPASAMKGLEKLFGKSIPIVLHRDRDFMMPAESTAFSSPYEENGLRIWLTQYSDVEAYWAHPDVVAAHFNVSRDVAQAVIDRAVESASQNQKGLKERRRKRNDALSKLNRKGDLEHYSDVSVAAETEADGPQFGILGKTITAQIRESAQSKGLVGSGTFGNTVPAASRDRMALDLKAILTEAAK
ncbi:ATP-dependent endonuclease [Frigoribacterium sp. MCBA15_019]|uniref:ATP-dependent nuclease n=1 Tax=Frigoribacterium sp. MCBA15_019 TaxID=1898745 RepID=UPI0009F33C4B|nr:AAA family ATPase [Frigoribacterium sp. MCBA15_019]